MTEYFAHIDRTARKPANPVRHDVVRFVRPPAGMVAKVERALIAHKFGIDVKESPRYA